MRTFEVGEKVRITKNSAGISNPTYLAMLGKETTVIYVDRACASQYRTEGGLRWDWKYLQKIEQPESKKPWRADIDNAYYTVSSTGVTFATSDQRFPCDSHRHEAGNYFENREEAEAVAAQILAIFARHREA